MAELSETQRELESHRSTTHSPALPIVDERYEFIEEIARGGAAVVWRVRDRHLGRETAVKYLLDSQDNREMRARLEKEARLCARLVHPGIVPIHELSNFADQRPFVSMKLVEGKTLLQLLESDPPPSLKSTIEIFAKTCQAMAYAHSKQIIHRDLKPGNIMVGSFGEVQIMDWGLAKDLADRSSVNDETSRPSTVAPQAVNLNGNSSGDTQTNAMQNDATIIGSVFGTIAYMSPEQANGQIELIDKRSDVFALGAVLCRLLTGISPYQDAKNKLGQDALLARAQHGDLKGAFERLTKARSPKLVALAKRCMAIKPSDRPADAAELVQQLELIRLATQRAALTRRFLSATTGLTVALTCMILWSNRMILWSNHLRKPAQDIAPASSPSIASDAVTLVHPMVALDSDTAKVMLKSDQKHVVLANYRRILDENPKDEELYFLVEMTLMNSARWQEGGEVARNLIKMNPGKPDYHFFLSESFFWRGKYEEAKEVMLQSKALRDGGAAAEFPIDKNLERLEKYIGILHQVSADPPQTFESLNAEDLLEVGNACGQADKFELANAFYRRSLAKEADAYRQSFSRNLLLLQFVDRNLQRIDLPDAAHKLLSAVCLEWTQEHFDSVRRLNNIQSSQLLNLLKSPTFDFARKLVDDPRVETEVQTGLKKLFSSIQEAKEIVVEH